LTLAEGYVTVMSLGEMPVKELDSPIEVYQPVAKVLRGSLGCTKVLKLAHF
jgi:hypothetical protein